MKIKLFNMKITSLTKRRLYNFKRNRRGYISLWIFLALFAIVLPAEFITNDKPYILKYKEKLYFPMFVDYPESEFGGFLPKTDYRDPFIKEEIEENGWMFWPPFRYSYRTINKTPPTPAPSPPSSENPLGTDIQSRDVLARLVYGYRISMIFALLLTIVSSVVGIIAGAVQGYFGGKVDLLFQRFIEIWGSIPSLFLLIILASIIRPGFWMLLILLTLFSWPVLTGVVRVEFLRTRSLDYVRAARALGVSNTTIMRKHILPNAMIATLTQLPFILSGAILSLTMLDYLGFGMPPGEPSIGELLSQGQANLHAPWLVLTAFTILAVTLVLVVFISEAVRDAFDPRKG